MAAKISATVVTGFLGAGKTTLIRHMLENAKGKRIALIINEFGDLGVDSDILKGCGIEACSEDDVVELSNGCICCTVADEFIPTMEMLLSRDNPPDHIVIETSGLALPQPSLPEQLRLPLLRIQASVQNVQRVESTLATKPFYSSCRSWRRRRRRRLAASWPAEPPSSGQDTSRGEAPGLAMSEPQLQEQCHRTHSLLWVQAQVQALRGVEPSSTCGGPSAAAAATS